MLNDFIISVNIASRSLGKNEAGTYDECARFDANIPIDGGWNTRKSINPQAYEKHKEEVKSDFGKFEENISDFSAEISPAVNELVEKFKKELEQELAKK